MDKRFVMAGVGALSAGLAIWVLLGGGMSTTAVALSMAYQLPPSTAQKMTEVAAQVGADPFQLAALINLESSWNPGAVNASSGAVGLIQFMPRTLTKMNKAFGQAWTPAKVRAMSADAQLDLVRAYLDLVRTGRWDDRQRGTLGTRQSLYMAVFYPKARFWNPGQRFPSAVTNANPGVRTPADYVLAVDRHAKTWTAA